MEEFEAWYRQEYPRVRASMALVCGDLHLAEEVSAEAFARALERWSRVRRMRSPGGWVHTVALNLLRRRQRRAHLERRLQRYLDPARVEADHAELIGQRDPVLWAALVSLPPRMRTAVVLRYVADLPEAEIAEVMGVSRGTVAAALHDARRRLAAVLAPAGGGTATAAPYPTDDVEGRHG